MPNTKLTLKLDEDVIAKGKEYARRHGTSLSQLVERTLASKWSEASAGAPRGGRDERFKSKEDIVLSAEVLSLIPARPHQGIDWTYDEMRAIYYQDREHSHSPR